MTFAEFSSWFQPFFKRNGGWVPENLEGWFNQNEENHQNIRKMMGGPIVQKFYKIDSAQGKLPNAIAKKYFNDLNYANVLEKNGLDSSAFDFPLMPSGSHNVVKTSKHISGLIYGGYSDGLITLEKFSESEKILSKLGDEWAKCRTSNIELEISISTTPRAFCLLGHYGPDADSCFRQNSSSAYDKWILGQSKDTFVITIAQKQKNYVNVARAIGFYNDRVVNVSNYYFEPKFKEGDGIAAITKLIEDVFGTKNPARIDNIVGYDGYNNIWKGFYMNPYGRWSFIPQDMFPISQILSLNLKDIFKFTCQRCNSACKAEDEMLVIDELNVCRSCVKLAKTSYLSGTKTFGSVLPFVTDLGHRKYILPDETEDLSLCPECGSYFSGDQEKCLLCE